MIIEFFGLPASGKTFTSRYLEKYSLPTIKFNSKIKKYFSSLYFIFSFPLTSFYFLLKLNSNSIFKTKIKLRIMRNILLLSTMACYQKAKLTKKPVILDEGFFQIIHTIFETKQTKKQIFNLLEKIPKPHILIIFNIEKNLRIKRLKNNKNLREKLFSRNYFNNWYKTMEYNQDIIIEYFKNKNINTHIINSTNIKELNKLILKLKCGSNPISREIVKSKSSFKVRNFRTLKNHKSFSREP